MKFSIITPIYNEENLIKTYFNNIKKLNFDLKNLEIIFVNDGSKDNSKEILKKLKKQNKKLNIKIYNNKNYGRSYTRKFGAEKAKYGNLIFLDLKSLIQKNSIKELEKYLKKTKEKCIIGTVENKFYENNLSSRIFYLFHKKLYSNFKKFDKIEINKKNFDNIPKGSGIMFCEKKLFLQSQIKNILNKNSSDDTKLIKNILNNSKDKKIIKLGTFLSFYYPRKKIFEEIKHTFQRGPKFIDYYFSKDKKYFYHILFFIFGSIFLFLSLFFYSNLLFFYFFIFLFFNFIISIYLSEKLKDFLICFVFCPIFIFSFFFGLIIGIFLKFWQNVHKYFKLFKIKNY
jgi:glycosyltransferase involved in cell wall biosynthesis